jgi:hypothetical protein
MHALTGHENLNFSFFDSKLTFTPIRKGPLKIRPKKRENPKRPVAKPSNPTPQILPENLPAKEIPPRIPCNCFFFF